MRISAIDTCSSPILEFGTRPQHLSGHKLRVSPDGRTGAEHIDALQQEGFVLSDGAKSIMRHPGFMPLIGVSYQACIVNGDRINEGERTTSRIREKMGRRGMMAPPIAFAPFLRELIRDQEMDDIGLSWLVVMHDPLEGASGMHSLLTLHRWNEALPYHLHGHFNTLNRSWGRGYGFVFVRRINP